MNSVLVGIDTNVLARYILQDDKQQSQIANEFFASLNHEYCGFVPDIVLVELVWLLKRGYKQPKQMIAKVIQRILAIRYLQVQNPESVQSSLNIYMSTSADFADLLISKTNMEYTCVKTVTFDKKASKHADMTILK